MIRLLLLLFTLIYAGLAGAAGTTAIVTFTLPTLNTDGSAAIPVAVYVEWRRPGYTTTVHVDGTSTQDFANLPVDQVTVIPPANSVTVSCSTIPLLYGSLQSLCCGKWWFDVYAQTGVTGSIMSAPSAPVLYDTGVVCAPGAPWIQTTVRR